VALSHDVRFWQIRVKANRPKPYVVRWKVGTSPVRSKAFEYRAMADSWRSGLIQAARRGEAFDEASGLSESELRKQTSVTFYELARRFVDLKWPRAAAKTRTSMADALATVTPVLVATTRGVPESNVLRAALYGWAFHKAIRESGPLQGDERAALDWLERNSIPVTVLDEKDRRSELIRGVLDAITLTLQGKPAAATTIARKRAVFYGVLNYAVELDLLPANPIDKVRWKAPKPMIGCACQPCTDQGCWGRLSGNAPISWRSSGASTTGPCALGKSSPSNEAIAPGFPRQAGACSS
jgi:hypothetical protein